MLEAAPNDGTDLKGLYIHGALTRQRFTLRQPRVMDLAAFVTRAFDAKKFHAMRRVIMNDPERP